MNKMVDERTRCAGFLFFHINTYSILCSCCHFFQIEGEMSTIKLMTGSLIQIQQLRYNQNLKIRRKTFPSYFRLTTNLLQHFDSIMQVNG